MRNRLSFDRFYFCSTKYTSLRKFSSSSTLINYKRNFPAPTPRNPCLFDTFKTTKHSLKPTSSFSYFTVFRFLSSASSSITDETRQCPIADDSSEEVEPIDSWEEEDEADPVIGDGGDGGGVVLQNCPWGERTLSIAHQVLQPFGNDLELFAFKTSHRGYIYVRLDKLSNEYGCPSMEEIESFSRQYKKILDEVGATGEIPDDLALDVSSPGVERLLRVPDDLLRFQDMPMVVSYCEESHPCPEKNGVYFLDLIETESRCCVWKLADVKENRDPAAKGRPMSRKQKDWRLKLPFDMIKRATLYVSN